MKQPNRTFLDSLPLPTTTVLNWAVHPPFPWIEVTASIKVAPTFDGSMMLESIAEYLQAPTYDLIQLIFDSISLYVLFIGYLNSGKSETDAELADYVRLLYQLVLNGRDAIQHLEIPNTGVDAGDDPVVRTQIYPDPQTVTTQTGTQS